MSALTPEVLTATLPALGALALVVSPRAWLFARPVVTLAHEGGHVVVALLAGRRPAGVRVHVDASGLTRSRGRSNGPGALATLAAGYVTPCLLGLGGAALVAGGRADLIVIVALGLLAGLLTTVRNLFGAALIVVTGAALLAVIAYAPAAVGRSLGALLAWFLLLGGLRSVVDLRRRRSRDSDADQLARVTRVPAAVWTLAFATVAIAAVAAAARLLLITL